MVGFPTLVSVTSGTATWIKNKPISNNENFCLQYFFLGAKK